MAYYDLTMIKSIFWNMVGLACRFWAYGAFLAFQYSYFNKFHE